MDYDHYTGKYRGAAYSVCNLRCSTEKDIPVMNYNGTNYDFKLLMKHFALYFKEDIYTFAENTEKYLTFSILVAISEVEVTNKDKDTKKDKDKNKDSNNDKKIKTVTHQLKFIDSNRFMAGSLDTHLNNLSELFDCVCKNKTKQTIKPKHDDIYVHSRCKTCNKRSKHDSNTLKEKFKYTYTLCNDNISKFLLLLRKGVYPYKYKDDFDKFKETKLPSREYFYGSLRDTNISIHDYRHAVKACNKSNCKNVGDCHDHYVQLDT